MNVPYVCSDFHTDKDVPDYCEGCKQPRLSHDGEVFASELLSPGSACPAYQVRLQQLRIANRIDGGA